MTTDTRLTLQEAATASRAAIIEDERKQAVRRREELIDATVRSAMQTWGSTFPSQPPPDLRRDAVVLHPSRHEARIDWVYDGLRFRYTRSDYSVSPLALIRICSACGEEISETLSRENERYTLRNLADLLDTPSRHDKCPRDRKAEQERASAEYAAALEAVREPAVERIMRPEEAAVLDALLAWIGTYTQHEHEPYLPPHDH
jgi:hypothetical protein